MSTREKQLAIWGAAAFLALATAIGAAIRKW